MSGAAYMAWVAGLILATASCKPVKPTDRPPEPAPTHAKKATARDVVIARIGPREITYGDLEDRLSALPVYVRVRYQAPERKLELLDSWLQEEVLALAAQRGGYGSDPAVVDALKNDLVERFVRDRVDPRVRTTDIPAEKVEAYYREHADDFHRPEQAEVLQLVVHDAALADRLAFRARRLIEGDDADGIAKFRELVQRFSEDATSKAAGGLLGRFPRLASDPRRAPAAVEGAAATMYALKQVSDPIAGAEGAFHVLFLATRHPAVDQPLEQARPRIVATLMENERERLRRELIDATVQAADVRVDESVMRQVVASASGGAK